MKYSEEEILTGIDVGSTTTKIVAMSGRDGRILYSDYRRHGARQLESVKKALRLLQEHCPCERIRLILTGSGAKPLAERLGVSYIQEVVANAQALKKLYRRVETAIELGGQDAKILFFKTDPETEELQIADMRMNGSCAGGTGAFLDEVAGILKIPEDGMEEMAQQGETVYDISGRCGVYAKTDIQPLLNQGVRKEDLVLSSFHAIAKQTIGGLAQGLTIRGPVAFEGGAMTYMPTLIRVFAERLGLKEQDILRPEHPELMVAYGAALSLTTMFRDSEAREVAGLRQMLEDTKESIWDTDGQSAEPFFKTEEEKQAFLARHAYPAEIPGAARENDGQRKPEEDGDTGELREEGAADAGQPACTGSRSGPGEAFKDLDVYLGIDSGSTTTKFVFMDEEDHLVDTFYGSNEGAPLDVIVRALICVRDRFRKRGIRLHIRSACTTGYGEMLMYKAFSADSHLVETVAHTKAAGYYVPDVTFLLDIGGQDMKAIWMKDGIITNILVNEACSSGCGSFLENFASTLNMKTEEIAAHAFASKAPAALGSRCTVFMNSSIVTAQRNGKTPDDIMAGLCRSIIENVFTKVIRVSNLDSLGDQIVVQGGTFRNDAVLAAMEQYTGRKVTRAPYPELMGAIGAALTAKESFRAEGRESTFYPLEELEQFSYRSEANLPCPYCTNHCKRMVMIFSNGNSWVTNNRCEKGETLNGKAPVKKEKAPDLYQTRLKLLFKNYPAVESKKNRGLTIGIPRVLYFWDTMPFWSVFFRSLGYQVKLSDLSTRTIYENGLQAVTSDTVCFPAKLVHGHIRNLAKKQVDRIFMPSVTTLPPENTEKTSESMCAVVKGYPLILKNSDNPETHWGIPLDAPLFHWHTDRDRIRQLTEYMKKTFGIPEEETRQAIAAGDRAQREFKETLRREGMKVLEETRAKHAFAVILASRPYQNDPLVHHSIPEMFTSLGIPVLTADALEGTETVDLSNSRLDVVNNYHGRMLTSAILAAGDPALEYVQLVSFGCGHDAYLSDEITRMMHEISGKTPLILKVDESDVHGPLQIRIRSFVETLRMKRRTAAQAEAASETEPGAEAKTGAQTDERPRALADPYPVKYTKEDIGRRTVLIPNTSHAFCRLMSAALGRQGVRTVPLEIGREEAIRLGKKYVHNDICFPAQIVIGEALAALKSGKYDPDRTAIGMGKYIGDCRLTHYSALLRKALDDAGFSQVPVLTNDDVDYHNMHPGYRMNLASALCIAFALPMIDVLEELLRKIRPYETVKGSAEQAFEQAMDRLIEGIERHGVAGVGKGFEKAIQIMKSVRYDRSRRRPQVLIVGEYLLNFHPGANHDIEAYLEKNGFEIIEARMTDVIRKSYFCRDAQNRELKLDKGFGEKLWYYIENNIFEPAHRLTDRIAKEHPLYTPVIRLPELVKDSDPIIPHTFDAGEGVLIPGEIIHHAKEGCRNFVILQPFGCLPNHVVGRGIVKKLKELYPDTQILSLDYDPDASFANVENRLQMLIMNQKNQKPAVSESGYTGAQNVRESPCYG